MNSIFKLQLIYFLIISSNVVFIQCEGAMFTSCKERNGTAKNIEVEINKSHGGEEAELILKFTPSKDSSAEAKRLIMAQISSSKNKLVDIPYGGTIDIAVDNSTFFERDGQKFVYPIRRDVALVHRYVFPILKGSTNSPVSMRYIIREKLENLIRNQRNWRKHPGAMIVCVNIRLV